MIKSIFYRADNTHGKHDGDEFAKEASRLAEFWEAENVLMPPAASKMEKISTFARLFSREALGWRYCEEDETTKIAFFGHGTKGRVLDFGFTRENASILAAMINALAPDAELYFFCCSLGAKGGFLEKLASLCPHAYIVGHTVKGHTTRNPYVFLSERGTIYRFRLPVIFENPEDWGDFEAYKEYVPKGMRK